MCVWHLAGSHDWSECTNIYNSKSAIPNLQVFYWDGSIDTVQGKKRKINICSSHTLTRIIWWGLSESEYNFFGRKTGPKKTVVEETGQFVGNLFAWHCLSNIVLTNTLWKNILCPNTLWKNHGRWEFVGNLFAWQCLSQPVMAQPAFFPRLSPNPPVIGAGLSNSEIQFTRRQPGIKVAAKGRIASSENAGNADLDPCSCSWVWRSWRI